MEHPLKILAQHWDLTNAQYLHLRLLCTLTLGPLLGTLYLVFFGRQRRPSVPAGPKPPMRINSDGQLVS